MPTLIKLLTAQGLEPVSYTADSLADAAQHEPPDGIYTVANTFNTYDTLKLDAHFERMEDSARRQAIPLQLERQRIRDALRQMIDIASYGDVRFRITVARHAPQDYILTIEPFTPPSPELRNQGVGCITAADSARHTALAKTTGWMHTRKALKDAMPDGIYETFLLDEAGYILEGLGSNFYAILDGELYSAGEGVLKGIAQQIVFEIAPPIIPLRKEAIHISQLATLSEAFLTSSSRGIIPVIEIDGIFIGAGKVSAVVKDLVIAYEKWVKDHLQAL